MHRFESTVEKQPSIVSDLSRGVFGLIWQTLRLPVLIVLGILEPIVRFMLSALALLALFAAFFFKLSGAAPHFPFWGTLGLSVACILLLLAYHFLMRLLSK